MLWGQVEMNVVLSLMNHDAYPGRQLSRITLPVQALCLTVGRNLIGSPLTIHGNPSRSSDKFVWSVVTFDKVFSRECWFPLLTQRQFVAFMSIIFSIELLVYRIAILKQHRNHANHILPEIITIIVQFSGRALSSRQQMSGITGVFNQCSWHLILIAIGFALVFVTPFAILRIIPKKFPFQQGNACKRFIPLILKSYHKIYLWFNECSPM